MRPGCKKNGRNNAQRENVTFDHLRNLYEKDLSAEKFDICTSNMFSC